MHSISQRAAQLPYSSIYKLDQLAQEAEARGIELIRLNVGQPDLPPHPEVLSQSKDLENPLLQYDETSGKSALRQAIAQYWQEKSARVSPEDVVITNGASEAIRFTLTILCNEGDGLLIPEPFYANMQGFATECGVELQAISTRFEQRYALPQIEVWEKALTPHTKAIWLTNPGNPTGHIYSEEELESIQELCLKHGLFLVCDEVYRGLEFDGHQHISGLQLQRIADHVVVIDSFSKRFNMPAARVGCMISRNREVMQAARLLAVNRLTVSSDGQEVARKALEVEPDFLPKLVSTYEKRRRLVQKWVERQDRVDAYIGEGGFYLMLKLQGGNALEFCSWLLSEFDHEGKSLLLTPADGFYKNKVRAAQEIRIALVVSESELQSALEILDAALHTYTQKCLGGTC